MKILERIKGMVEENPGMPAKEIAKLLGVSRQHVYMVCKTHNIALSKGYRLKPRSREKGPFQYAGKSLSSHFVGGASELTACSDLLRKGIPVYRALTFVSAADLIVDINGELLRVEVKSARRKATGGLSYSIMADNADKYDILALVDQDGVVTYKPDILALT